MSKSKPHSVRFEENDFDFICRREQLKTAQQVVTFLLSEYLKLYKVEKKSVFAVVNEVYDSGKLPPNFSRDEPLKFEKPKPPKILKTVQLYISLKRECNSQEEWDEIWAEVESAEHLSDKQKLLIKTA